MIISLLIIGVMGYLAGLVLVYKFQRSFMYIPPREYKNPAEFSLPEMQVIRVDWSKTEYVTAWWAPPEDGNPVIMFFHGNGGAVYHDAHIFRDLIDRGIGVWVTGYPGYPGASGKASQSAMETATFVQFDLLKSDYAPDREISLYGTSLGAAQAVHLARRRQVNQMILEAPFHSMTRMVRLKMPIYAFDPLIKDKWENDVLINEIDVPLLWLHGRRDRVIPMREGQRLFDLYEGPKDSLIIDDGDHVNIWVSGGRERIMSFLSGPDDRP